MLINFFMTLKKERLPVSFTELFSLLECLKQNIIFANVEDFYYLSRMCFVKDEKNFDKFDIAFGKYFENIDAINDLAMYQIPDDWLRKQMESMLSDEEKAKIEALGGLDKLMEEFRKRMEEQQKRHEGGNKWIGTGGTSPFGAYGYNPEGIRIGQQEGRNGSAVKVWDKRNYRDLDDSVEIGTRNIKMALRRLRKFARTGAAEELDINDTISSTAKNAGLLDIKMVPERHNSVKVLLFFDVGGSMDPHVKLCEELFSAARTEFKHLKYYYFHNFIYESVWTKSHRRHAETTSTFDIINKYSKDYKIIFVGDATMAPYEVTHVGGSIEHYNEEAGAVWIKRLTEVFDHMVWINPTPKTYWEHSYSIEIVKELLEDRMFPMSVKGLEEAMALLTK
ncbi:MAG: VWA domain-containing protein [Gammaproteobacteria bacterium]|nr:VWA domain-containing protein [Gammaproteobacteria bacterium]MDG2338198.1 VWA domain-containing protein [Gammaproteobacteria bacterium]